MSGAVREIPSVVRKTKVIRLILDAPPPMPKCWRSMHEWQDWLMLAHTAGERITRRADIATYSGHRTRLTREAKTVFAAIDYCVDCPAQKKVQMLAEQRCFPAVVAVREPA